MNPHMKATQEVLNDFFGSILDVIARNSSKKYGLVIFQNMKKKLRRDFSFLNKIKIGGNEVHIDKSINNVDKKKIRALLKKIIEILGTDVLKLLVKEQLGREDIEYLNQIGVRL